MLSGCGNPKWNQDPCHASGNVQPPAAESVPGLEGFCRVEELWNWDEVIAGERATKMRRDRRKHDGCSCRCILLLIAISEIVSFPCVCLLLTGGSVFCRPGLFFARTNRLTMRAGREGIYACLSDWYHFRILNLKLDFYSRFLFTEIDVKSFWKIIMRATHEPSGWPLFLMENRLTHSKNNNL